MEDLTTGLLDLALAASLLADCGLVFGLAFGLALGFAKGLEDTFDVGFATVLTAGWRKDFATCFAAGLEDTFATGLEVLATGLVAAFGLGFAAAIVFFLPRG